MLTGIDVLAADGFAALDGLKIGLITNHSGLARDGKTSIDLLHGAENVDLVKLFSPEHGIRGTADEKIGDDVDRKTGLTIHSLYGETRIPTPELLEDIDALVFDIQDIGCRFYTYISTMGNCMEVARDTGKKFFVLDRPNPIGGVKVEGPLLEGKRSFVGYHDIPVRHGMTVGELAELFRAELFLELELTVIKVENWSRDQLYVDTGLAWVNPSPNIRNLTEALMYPGIGLLEFTNLSVGRGTKMPFELVGAPYIDPDRFAAALEAHGLPGIEFIAVRFTPEASKFANEECGGVRILLKDRSADTVDIGIALGVTLRALYPDQWQVKELNKLLSHPSTHDAILNKTAPTKIRNSWAEGIRKFTERRATVLLY